jgi:hypothetical protein
MERREDGQIIIVCRKKRERAVSAESREDGGLFDRRAMLLYVSSYP